MVLSEFLAPLCKPRISIHFRRKTALPDFAWHRLSPQGDFQGLISRAQKIVSLRVCGAPYDAPRNPLQTLRVNLERSSHPLQDLTGCKLD